MGMHPRWRQVPLLYLLLIWASSNALRTGIPTRLSRATAFLTADYQNYAFWWEPLQMCRKLALSIPPLGSEPRDLLLFLPIRPGFWSPPRLAAGWVLLIGEEYEQARVLVALLVSIASVALHLSVKPLRRIEDSYLTSFVELALVLVYLCVLLIKSCDPSSVTRAHRDAEASSV